MQTLAQAIKAKHPEYNDWDDADLEKAIKQKYPGQYEGWGTTPTGPTEAERNAKVGPSAPTAGRGTGYDPRNAPSNLVMLKQKAPMIAGIAAAPFTEGLSIPAAMAVTGGATAVTALATGHGLPESAMEGALSAAPEALRGLAPAAVALYRRAAGGATREGAELAMNSGHGLFTQSNADALSRSKILDPQGVPFRNENKDAYWAVRNGIERGSKGPNLGTEAAAGAAGDMIAGRKGAALGILGSTAARPGTGSAIAVGMNKVAQNSPGILGQAIRAALSKLFNDPNAGGS